MNLKEKIRNIPDFPRKGIVFRDITTLWKDPLAFRYVIDEFANRYRSEGIDLVVGIESRGFIVGSPLAYVLDAGFVPLRKMGKLPGKKIIESYELEYGKEGIEIHTDAIQPGQKVLIVDDLLATGGTALASAKLVERLGGKVVGICFIVELEFLKGREKLKGYNVSALTKYETE